MTHFLWASIIKYFVFKELIKSTFSWWTNLPNLIVKNNQTSLPPEDIPPAELQILQAQQLTAPVEQLQTP
jgi:hypothetical protein